MEKKLYISPKFSIYEVNSYCLNDNMSGGGQGSEGEEVDSKGTCGGSSMWEYMDDED